MAKWPEKPTQCCKHCPYKFKLAGFATSLTWKAIFGAKTIFSQFLHSPDFQKIVFFFQNVGWNSYLFSHDLIFSGGCNLQVAGCRLGLQVGIWKRVKCLNWLTDLLKQDITMVFWWYHILDRVRQNWKFQISVL